MDVQENALSNAPPVGDRGDTNYYTVDAEGNYVDPNTLEHGSAEYTAPDGTKAGSAIDVQLMEAVHAETDPTIKADLEASWEEYTGKDYPAGDPAWDDYYTKTEIPATDQSGWSQVSYADADAQVGDIGLGNNPTLPTADLISDLINPDYNPDDILGTGQIFKDTTENIPTENIPTENIPTETTPVDKGDGSGYADVDNWDEAAWQNMVDTVLEAQEENSEAEAGKGDGSGYADVDNWNDAAWQNMVDTVLAAQEETDGEDTGPGEGPGEGPGDGPGDGPGSGGGTGGGTGSGSGTSAGKNWESEIIDLIKLKPIKYKTMEELLGMFNAIKQQQAKGAQKK